MLTLVLSAAVALHISAVPVGSAAVLDGAVPAQVTVHYDDLNLDNPAGLNVLRLRIRAAARRVCGEPTRLLAVEARRRACVAQAVENAETGLVVAGSTVQTDG